MRRTKSADSSKGTSSTVKCSWYTDMTYAFVRMVAEAAAGKSKHQELQAQAKAAAKARRLAELKDKHGKPVSKESKSPTSPVDGPAATTPEKQTSPTDAGDPPVVVLNEGTDHPTVKA